jgi:hypothetical protein
MKSTFPLLDLLSDSLCSFVQAMKAAPALLLPRHDHPLPLMEGFRFGLKSAILMCYSSSRDPWWVQQQQKEDIRRINLD